MSVGKLTGATSRESDVRPNGVVVESKNSERTVGDHASPPVHLIRSDAAVSRWVTQDTYIHVV